MSKNKKAIEFQKKFRETQRGYFFSCGSPYFDFDGERYFLFESDTFLNAQSIEMKLRSEAKKKLNSYLKNFKKPETYKTDKKKDYFVVISDNDQPSSFGYDENGAIVFEQYLESADLESARNRIKSISRLGKSYIAKLEIIEEFDNALATGGKIKDANTN